MAKLAGRVGRRIGIVGACMALALCLGGCAAEQPQEEHEPLAVSEAPADSAQDQAPQEPAQPTEVDLRAQLDLTEDYRDAFVHGEKGAEFQKYIVLHDTESEADGESVVSSWDNAGIGVAAHFIVNKDGSIVQCVDMDKIAHHAGWGDTGHDESFGVTDESRDDKVGQKTAPSWAKDYGMNSYSVGVEMVHVGGSGDYPTAQLEALDKLIAYIDAHYGSESTIIDHKMWRSGNSDTSPEFATYLANYQDHRSYK